LCSLPICSNQIVPSQFVAYALIALFILAERRLRKGQEAQTLNELPSDKGTTRQIGAAFVFALCAGLAAPLLNRIGLGRLRTHRIADLGIALMLTGLVVRVWSARTLGRFYTRTLRVTEDQSVITDGPYRWVRHPGYAADIVLWCGFGLAAANLLVTAIVVTVMLLVYARRIAAEEAMLNEQLGVAYAKYARRAARLLPGVY
jgi:protein-S-isoprenylcysteine O-methyltransferase Ste14